LDNVNYLVRRGARMAELRLEVARADRQLDNLAQRMRRLEAEGDDFLERAYRDQREEKKQLAEELAKLESHTALLNRQALEQQLAVDPRDIVPMLFGGDASAEQVRAVLAHVFPGIVLRDRPQRFVSVWAISVCAGAVVACLSGTKPVIEKQTEYVVRVETGAKRPTPWRVTIEDN